VATSIERDAVRVHIRDAVAGDAEPLSRFAAAVFRATYGAITDGADMDAHVAEFFTTQAQVREIADVVTRTLIATVDQEIAGFAQCRRDPAPPCLADGGLRSELALQIKRFYVGIPWHGRGVAQHLMSACIDLACAHEEPVWLGVQAQNSRAIRFYAKSGFQRVGVYAFTLGAETHVDDLMARSSVTGIP
jgi:ribosomal protein S18 acetylase RimI-like enzyme